MTREGMADRVPEDTAANDLAAIPILLEPVPDAPATAGPAPAAVTQQSLFDDAGAGHEPPARRPVRRTAPSPELVRAAGHILRARTPAIIDEIVAAHAERLAADLRTRLHEELESLLADMAGDSPRHGT